MSTSPLAQITKGYEEGYSSLFITGRSPHDLVVDPNDRKMRPLIEVLRRHLRQFYGMAFMTYSLAGGLDWDKARIEDDRDRKSIEQALKANNLMDIPQDENEPARVIRGLSSLLRTPTKGLQWADRREMRFAVLLQFGEHLTPGGLLNGTQTDNQIIAIELANTLAQSLALRTSGNLLMFHGRDGLIDELVKGALHNVHLKQPKEEEKLEFLEVAVAAYPEASFEQELTIAAAARMTTNTPNRGLESMLRASHRSGIAITVQDLTRQKNSDVELTTEGTVRVLDTQRVADVQLCGINITRPKEFLERCAQGLLNGDPNIPSNIILVGPPGTAKTDLCLLTARLAKVSAYQLDSPKGGVVGETERKVRLQWSALNEWTPNISFIDEITEAMPLQRGEFDGDSGASRAVTAQLLSVLADESRRGKTMLVATTNCPWRMGEAMRTRFTILPILFPLLNDYSKILVATALRVSPAAELDENDPRIIEAAGIFYNKGASPRHVRAQLSTAMILRGLMNEDTILTAANNFCASTDRISVNYTELWAVKACSSKSLFPWDGDIFNYPFPDHLKNLVDVSSGEIDAVEIDRRLREYEPYVNV